MKTKTISIVALFFQVFHYINMAQTADTSQLKLNHTYKPHNRLFKVNVSSWSEPKKAGVLSAILPGAGQIYNKKYWKAPVIYLAGGVLVFNTIHQNNNYLYFKKELINVLNGKMNENGYSAQQLTLLKNQSKKWRDLSIAGIVLVYVLNVIDASVDAHLKKFDISDNLSVVVSPLIVVPPYSTYTSINQKIAFCGVGLKLVEK